MKKIISTLIFTCAIVIGVATGYAAVRTSKVVYGSATAYVAEVTTNLKFSQDQQGGPKSEPSIVENKFIKTKLIDTRAFYILDQNKKLNVSSQSYMIADIETGKIILSKNINQQFAIASITKLMTAIVADETLGLDYNTTVDATAIATYGTQGDLRKGERYSVAELLLPLLLESSNDAGEALALAKDRASFISDMNLKAKSIGLLNTQFDDASGLSANNRSTVTDLFKLIQYIHSYRQYIFEITVENKKQLRNKTWLSNSRFKNDPTYLGGKNGYTDEARKTQIALFEEVFGEEKRTIAYIILRSEDIGGDMKTFRNYVVKNVELK